MPQLAEADRKKLDGIIVQMSDAGATDDEIRTIVADFKSKYEKKVPAVLPGKPFVPGPEFLPVNPMAPGMTRTPEKAVQTPKTPILGPTTGTALDTVFGQKPKPAPKPLTPTTKGVGAAIKARVKEQVESEKFAKAARKSATEAKYEPYKDILAAMNQKHLAYARGLIAQGDMDRGKLVHLLKGKGALPINSFAEDEASSFKARQGAVADVPLSRVPGLIAGEIGGPLTQGIADWPMRFVQIAEGVGLGDVGLASEGVGQIVAGELIKAGIKPTINEITKAAKYLKEGKWEGSPLPKSVEASLNAIKPRSKPPVKESLSVPTTSNPKVAPVTGPKPETTPVVEPPSVAEPPSPKAANKPVKEPEDAFGLATRFEKEGAPFSDQKHGVRVAELADRGKSLMDEGRVSANSVYDKVRLGQPITPEDGAVAAYRGTQLENRAREIVNQLNDPKLDPLLKKSLQGELENVVEKEMTDVLAVGNQLQKTFHQTGQTLQVAFSPKYERVQLGARAKAANYGEALSEPDRIKFDSRIAELEKQNKLKDDAIAKLKDELDKSKTARLGGMRSTNPSVKRQALVRGIMSDLGLGKGDVGPGFKSKQTGAINIPEGMERRVNSKITQLAKLYLSEGAKDLDAVVTLLQKDLPLLTREDIYSLLSGKYRTAALQSDIAKLNINRQLGSIRKAAEFRQKTFMQKAATYSGDALLSLQREMQAGLDLSFSLIQGAPGLITSPTNWLKAWRAVWEPFTKGEQGALEATARLQKQAGYREAVKHGVAFADSHATPDLNEEIFQGGLMERIRSARVTIGGKQQQIPVIGQVAETIARSNEGYNAFLNQLRLDLFKKFAGGNFSDPAVMRDAARLANIVTGRGDGRMAAALANRNFGYFFYAPRFMLSSYQNAGLPMLLPTFASGQGKTAALSVWSKQAAAVYGSLFIAKQFGLDVETDPRSPNFGQITLPDGSQYNPLRRITDPVRFVSMQFGGSFNSGGDYQPPDFRNNAYLLGKYLMGKASPISRLGGNVATGSHFDPNTKESESFDLLSSSGAKTAAKEAFIPLAWQEALRSGDLSGVLAAILGTDYNPSKDRREVAPKVPWRNPKPVDYGASFQSMTPAQKARYLQSVLDKAKKEARKTVGSAP